MFKHTLTMLLAGIAVTSFACSDSSDEKGTARFTTWGEEYIEQGIPASPDGEDGFVDGWSIKYSKFLVSFHDIAVADAAGNVVARLDRPRFVDNTKVGIKELVSFPDLEAKAYTQVSYAIKPAVADEVIVSGDPADHQLMVANGWSIYVEGTATNGAATKTFKWGFKSQTRYTDCQAAAENGLSTTGLVVTNNQTDTSELTTHGDHFFYDALQSGDSTKPTRLRFAEKAQADDAPNGDGNGEVTIAELCKLDIDPEVYNPSGLTAGTIGDFVIQLSRTVGHYRGEGECTVSRIDAVPATAATACDEYK